MSEARELERSFARELGRHVGGLGAATDDEALRRALHALRGSAAHAGHHDLGLLLAQLSQRWRAGDARAAVDARALLLAVHERLDRGLPALDTSWPLPPRAFVAPAPDPRFAVEYRAAANARAAELEASDAPAVERLSRARAALHAIKGAAGAVGDDFTAWYVHGLESRLREIASTEEALALVEAQRGLLGLMIADPSATLAALRAGRVADAEPSSDGQPGALRLASSTAERWSDGLDRVRRAAVGLGAAAHTAQFMVARLANARAALLEALRLIGPARPWGAPVAALARIERAANTIGVLGDQGRVGAAALREHSEQLEREAQRMTTELGALQRASLADCFARVEQAARRAAAGAGLTVELVVRGSELAVDRRVGERLVEPLVQLVRNAVAHAGGTERSLRLELVAERVGDWLRVALSDDGPGVDPERLRELARARGLPESARVEELLHLLFLPDVTTRSSPDALAGRGLGLGVAQEAVRRVGGVMRLRSPVHGGFGAVIEVPADRSLLDVVWVIAQGQELALPLHHSGRVRAEVADGEERLAECLDLTNWGGTGPSVEICIEGVEPVVVGVDQVGAIETVYVRPLPAIVARSGPWSGAVSSSDGRLRLVLDPALLLARVWARRAARGISA